MDCYLLDTNLISELIKKRPAGPVVARLRPIPKKTLFTSVICVMELRYGAACHPQGKRLWQRISSTLLDKIQVAPLGLEEVYRAGDILALLKGQGEPIGVEDVLIGATALTHGWILVTRNEKHFLRIPGLQVENWWAREAED